MKIDPTPLTDALLLTPTVFGDERGFFMESWNDRVFQEAGIRETFVQDNHSRSAQGILRGLHYQTENTQGKLVRVTQGRVYDVAVDLRRSSASFGQWFGVELCAGKHTMLWVPPGFAHGFYVLSDSADFLYKTTDYYHPASEVSLAWNDPTLNIPWPLIDGQAPNLSSKDQQGLTWAEAPLFD